MEQLSAVLADFGKEQTKRNMYAGASRRSYEPVRRFSFRVGREGVFWRPVKRQDVRKIVLAARRFDRCTKEKGSRNGALGHVALEILDYLANLVDYRTGRLDPCLDTLMEKLCRSRDAIVRALKALRTHGFIDWLRRYVPTGNVGKGVQVRQTSNAYRLSMPRKALKYLGRYGEKTPISDDLEHAQAEQAAQDHEWREQLTLTERVYHDIEDDKLAASLAKLASAIENKRESAKQSESLSKSLFNRKTDRLTPDLE